MAETPAILCQGVTFRYLERSRPILENAALSVPAGCITVLMGSSGCGKSTLAAVLCGLLPENGGFLMAESLELFGRPLGEYSVGERSRAVSMMFQNPDLQFCMDTLRREMVFCLENQCCPPAEMEEKILAAAKAIGVEHLLNRPLHTLSGGEKQRAVLACIYLLDARCILLDEPFANLDPDAVSELMALLKALCRERGKTILAIDHIADHWMGTADRFLLLGKGGQVLLEAEDAAALEQGKPLFREQGVAYPGIWKETAIPALTRESRGNALTLAGFSMPRADRLSRKKRALPEGAECLLQNVEAAVPQGRITAVLGRSGSGKTTLLMTLLGQLAYGGSLRLETEAGSRELRTLREKELFREVGIAFQNPENQFVTQNVTEELLEGLRRRNPKAGEEALKQQALALLDSCGLRPFQKYSPYMLSQGQQRRLAVLAVLSGGQRVLLLDEPTYGQDYTSARALMELVREKVEAEGLTVIMTTHDWGLARCYADAVYHLKENTLCREVEE